MNTIIDPAGTFVSGPRWRSTVRAWRIVKVLITGSVVHINTPLDSNGKIRDRFLKSSTCCTEHSLHEFTLLFSSVSIAAAWFRSLHLLDWLMS